MAGVYTDVGTEMWTHATLFVHNRAHQHAVCLVSSDGIMFAVEPTIAITPLPQHRDAVHVQQTQIHVQIHVQNAAMTTVVNDQYCSTPARQHSRVRN